MQKDGDDQWTDFVVEDVVDDEMVEDVGVDVVQERVEVDRVCDVWVVLKDDKSLLNKFDKVFYKRQAPIISMYINVSFL